MEKMCNLYCIRELENLSSLVISAPEKRTLETQNKCKEKKKYWLAEHVQRKIKNLFFANCHPTEGFEMLEFSPSV